MPVLERQGKEVWRKRDRREILINFAGWLLGALLVLYCWEIISRSTIWMFALDAPLQISNLFGRMIPPNWAYAEQLWGPLWDTLNIATLGTALAIMMGAPMAFLAARNTTPHPLLRQFALLVIVSSRSINALIWALLLVAIMGPGVLAGVIAISIRAVGFVGKLLYEAIEEIDPKQVEAIRATGAGQGKVLIFGIVPQILPAFAGISVYRWDINIRESTMVGLVGAGGIGIPLNASVLGLRWADAAVIFITIFLLVIVSEWVSARVRQAII